LVIRSAARLHTAGECVAFVDCGEPGLRGDDGDTARWCLAVGQRIAQNCGLRPEAGDWWLEKYAARGGRALADFLWQVVLTNTTKPITVFVDRIEHVAGTERAQVLFDTIAACRVRRTEEPDYGRVTFVLAGVATRRRLWPATAGSPSFPFDAVALDDFTPEETYKLAPGFGGDAMQTRALLDRILAWTSGHPYLTQKIARGVARKGGRLEHVEQIVESQLLAPQALHDEPLFAEIQRKLEPERKTVRQARVLLTRIAKGRVRVVKADTVALEELVLAGLVTRDEASGAVRFRNRVLREVFAGRTVTGSSTKRNLALAASLLVAAVAGGAFWYTQRLPQPALEVLASADAPLPALAAAHAELSALPGFTERAAALYVAALVERSAAAATVAEAVAVDELLRSAGHDALAARLLGGFWLRRAAAAAHSGERDAALLLAVEAHAAAERRPVEVRTLAANGATSVVASPAVDVAAFDVVADPAARARSTLAMLADADYPSLEYSGRFAEEPLERRIDWSDSSFTLRHGDALRRVPLTAAPVAVAPAIVPTALAPNPLTREIVVRDEGSAGAFSLELEIEHPDYDELTATLTAPSGAWVELPVTLRTAGGVAMVATSSSPLARLSDEARGGSWRLTVVDRRTGRNGTLRAWRLAFSGEEIWVDAPPLPIGIPDPARTENVLVTLGASGRYAVARPAEPGGVDSVAVWSVAEGSLVSEIALAAPVTAVALSPDDARLIVVMGDTLTLWDAASGDEIARIGTQAGFLRAPLFATDGSHFLIAERFDGGSPLVSLLRSADGALVARMER
jgi:subtilisin-like proprotein convertase family protein